MGKINNYNARSQKALIFIPDISGFTRFINDTDISHSRHIISELLEVIIESNELNLKVSEIEGDAVLFYQTGGIPDAWQLAAQVKKMFINFHNYLKIIERDNVCQCGACSMAPGLTIKFFAHSGEISLSRIKGREQLMGKDVILAHRIMKNDVPGNEYLLITKPYLDHEALTGSLDAFDWSDLRSGESGYEHIGIVPYKYVTLTPLRTEVVTPPMHKSAEKYDNPVSIDITVDAPVAVVYDLIIDLNTRSKWRYGLRNIWFDSEAVPRIGSVHVCDLEMGKTRIEAVEMFADEGSREYAERMLDNRFFPEATTFFNLKPGENGTELHVEFHYRRRAVMGWLIDLMMRKKVKNSMERSAGNLKNLCEEISREKKDPSAMREKSLNQD
ncbi:MAG: DUF2652 domain-containing protein [Calditrichaceae bacterium]